MPGPRFADHVFARQVGEELVLLDLEGSRYLSLNPMATWLWGNLERGVARDHLASHAALLYGLSPEEVDRDIEALVADLTQRKLIVPPDSDHGTTGEDAGTTD